MNKALFLVMQTLQIAAGGMHSVALTASHEVWSCGVNDEGALGRHTGSYSARFHQSAYICEV